MRILSKKALSVATLVISAMILTACSSTQDTASSKPRKSSIYRGSAHRSDLSDPIIAISSLSEQQHEWKGTRYRIGGNSKSGIDCSGFIQVTFRDLFGIDLPRMTVDQAKEGERVDRDEIRTGDLVFFNTGRGPNGKHVGVYVKNGQFLHASTKGGVIYSDMNSPYWSRTFWQARRL